MKICVITLLTICITSLFGQTLDTIKVYTDKGDLATIEVWDKSNSYQSLLYKKIYWQDLPNGEFLFVSNEGFVTVNNGVSVLLDATTPDNIIDTDYGTDGTTILIWKNGKKEPYTGGQRDGIEIIYDGPNPGVYEWKKGNKTLKRKLTQQDFDERDKILKEEEEMLKMIMDQK